MALPSSVQTAFQLIICTAHMTLHFIHFSPTLSLTPSVQQRTHAGSQQSLRVIPSRAPPDHNPNKPNLVTIEAPLAFWWPDHHRIPQREVIKMGKNCVGTKHVLWNPISIGLSTWSAGRVVQWWRPDRVGTCCRHPRKERRLVTYVGGGILTSFPSQRT